MRKSEVLNNFPGSYVHRTTYASPGERSVALQMSNRTQTSRISSSTQSKYPVRNSEVLSNFPEDYVQRSSNADPGERRGRLQIVFRSFFFTNLRHWYSEDDSRSFSVSTAQNWGNQFLTFRRRCKTLQEVFPPTLTGISVRTPLIKVSCEKFRSFEQLSRKLRSPNYVRFPRWT